MCKKCDGIGIYYRSGKKGGIFDICDCSNVICTCSGESPYQYFEGDQGRFCQCREYRNKIDKVERIFAKSAIPERFKFKFLKDYKEKDPTGAEIRGVPQLKGLISNIVEKCESGAPYRGLFLWGNTGNGKTMAGCILLNELMLHCQRQGRYLNLSSSYFQKLRDTFNRGSDDYGRAFEIVEYVSKVSFLVIDDFGVQRNTDWEKEMLYDLVDTRYGQERLTAVTTNLNLDEVKSLAGGRIYSRFAEMCHIVNVKSPDYRLKLERSFEIGGTN